MIFFKGSETYYWLDIILPDGQDRASYVQTIYDFYQKLTTKQSHAFELTAYANGVEVFDIYYVKSEKYNGQLSYDDVNNEIDLESSQPIPDDEWMVWDYRIKEDYLWLE